MTNATRFLRTPLARIALVVSLVLGVLFSPVTIAPAQACQVLEPDYKMNFDGVAVRRARDSVTDQETWFFRVTKWRSGSAGVKPRKKGTVIPIKVTLRNPDVEATDSCGDIGITTQFITGAKYRVTATKYKQTDGNPQEWHVISYTGAITALSA